ncbi:hypothetical protein FQN60_005195, partial [Etheostoma spectabile]
PGVGPRPDFGSCSSESQHDSDAFSPISSGSPSTPLPPTSTHGRSISISVLPCSDGAFTLEPSPPPATQASKTRTTMPSHTPPQPSRKLLHLLPNIALTRSKSQESQLANRIEEPAAHKACKKNKVLAALHINGSGNPPEDSALRSPLLSARTPGPVPASAPYTMPAAPTQLENVTMHRSSPQTMRRDIGLAVTHRFSTKSWLSQMCQVCRKSMMFGVKCKHCNSTMIQFYKTMGTGSLPRIRRAESVPSDINNQIDHTAKIPLQFGTLPKAINKREPPPSLNHLDSSSNPSSATSSTPSSPAHFQQNNPPSVSATPPPNASPQSSRDSRFHFPGQHPVTGITHVHTRVLCNVSTLPTVQCVQGKKRVSQVAVAERQLTAAEPAGGDEEDEEEEAADQGDSAPTEQPEEDELDELPSSICRRGAGRWGKVHKGRWHGEVAIRLLEVDGNNQDHLKLFKKEVMNYRQTRHENVVLFMGACMAPPHLAIITSFCKGVTLYSVVRDRSHILDINKTRQIALDIVKGMGYLHAKGIIHKDLKSKNVFYDTNKVVITDLACLGCLEWYKKAEDKMCCGYLRAGSTTWLRRSFDK